MNALVYETASREQRALMLSQAESRLGDQLRFADAADTRASIFTGVAAALASAGVGLFAASLEGGINLPMAFGGLTAAIGFGLAARRAMQSARSQEFHVSGYRPSDFLADIRDQKALAKTQAEIAADLEERLAYNSEALRKRAKMADDAMDAMWATPIWAAAAALVGWLLGLIPAVAQLIHSVPVVS